jgi:hypothetical protein
MPAVLFSAFSGAARARRPGGGRDAKTQKMEKMPLEQKFALSLSKVYAVKLISS